MEHSLKLWSQRIHATFESKVGRNSFRRSAYLCRLTEIVDHLERIVCCSYFILTKYKLVLQYELFGV